MIEERGVPTVAIGLVRRHVETSRPPRALWAPFQLGRPLGEPEDPAFQRRVLVQAQRLLERADGPALLEDFPDDPPGWRDTPGWAPPFALAPPGAPPASPATWTAALAAEIEAVRPWRLRFQARFGRTTVGLSGMPPEAWPDYAAAFLGGGAPAGPPPRGSPALSLRYLADDLKAFHMEAVQAEGPAASSRQLDGWFWAETVAGRMLIALRGVAVASESKGLQTVARFLVPAHHLPGG